MKVFVIRDSQLSNANMAKSIMAFVAATKLSAEQVQIIARQQGGLPFDKYSAEELANIMQGAIWQYKTGVIRSEAEFRARMNAAMGVELSEAEFSNCWNAMCDLIPQQTAIIRDILDLHARNLNTENAFTVHIIASSNPMHQACLAAQFIAQDLDLSGITYTRSYEVASLDPQQLMRAAAARFAAGDILVDLRDIKVPLIHAIRHELGRAPAPLLAAAGASAGRGAEEAAASSQPPSAVELPSAPDATAKSVAKAGLR